MEDSKKKNKHDVAKIWRDYESGTSYKSAINLYDDVKLNQAFYLGDQWLGVKAPDIEKPVINIIRQAVDYYVSMLVSDDIGVSAVLPDDVPDEVKQAIEYVVSTELDKVFEQTRFKQRTRKFIRDTALDGDHAMYWRFNSEKQKLDLELIDNTNVIFGDPTDDEVERQPYIMIIQKRPIKELKELCRKHGVDDAVKEDSMDYNQQETDAQAVTKYGTLITKFYKEEGVVYAVQSMRHVVLKEVSLGIRHYPIVWMSWRHKKDSYHGVSPITGVRQNQIMINKYYMMLNEFTKKLSFPKVFYDATKIARWSNKVEAVGVNGNPNEAFATSSPTVQLSAHVMQFIENLIQTTKETLGVFDSAIGNVKPENTSAIIALQKSASQPLELQKMDYYQVVEDSVRIILDLMAVNYGVRLVPVQIKPTPEEAMLMGSSELIDMQLEFDFAELSSDNLELVIEVGASAYWTELMQIQTLDNMYRAGIIPNPKTYVEQMPNGILKSKSEILDAIEEHELMMQQQMMQQQMMAMGPGQVDVGGAIQK